MRTKIKQLSIRKSHWFTQLRAKRWFKPVMITVAICLALGLVGVSYAALLNRNNVTNRAPENHKTTKDLANKAEALQAPSNSSATPSPPLPASLLNLTNWYLTLPVAKADSDEPETIKQPQLNSFAMSPYFQLNGARDGVIFQAPVNGVTTENSKYPRSELREMAAGGSQKASWSNTNGTHLMSIRQAITHLPIAKPHVVAGQIHDASDDVIMIRLEGRSLFVEANGKNIATLDNSYQLGRVFTVDILAASGRIQIAYNGTPRVTYIKSGSGFYFKAGCYTQSNPSKGDSPDAYGEVVIYNLNVSHT